MFLIVWYPILQGAKPLVGPMGQDPKFPVIIRYLGLKIANSGVVPGKIPKSANCYLERYYKDR